jgi:hypothetical protein
MPGLVKVGYTDRLGELRAEELYTTGVPLPFRVEFRTIASKPKEVEQQAHRLLAAHRLNTRREFFEVLVDVAVNAVREALHTSNGIEAWATSKEIIRLKSRDRLALTCREGELFTLITYKTLSSLISARRARHLAGTL